MLSFYAWGELQTSWAASLLTPSSHSDASNAPIMNTHCLSRKLQLCSADLLPLQALAYRQGSNLSAAAGSVQAD